MPDPRPDIVHVTRTVRLAAPATAAMVGTALTGADGITAHALTRKDRVRLTYDLRRTGIDEIVDRLAAQGLAPATGWLQRLRLGWAAFTEANRRDHLRHVGHCCSKPPAGSGRG